MQITTFPSFVSRSFLLFWIFLKKTLSLILFAFLELIFSLPNLLLSLLGLFNFFFVSNFPNSFGNFLFLFLAFLFHSLVISLFEEF